MRPAVRLSVCLAAALVARTALGAGRPMLQQPAPSPDGKEIAFVTAGAIWAVPSTGGDAHPLVADVGDCQRPLYSPDGKRLAFTSNKTGNGDLYVLTFDTGELKRLTYDDASERLDGWSPDGKTLYFDTGGHEVGGTTDIYKVSVDGGTPMPVVAEPYGSAFFAAAAPDGKTVAFCGGGMAGSQWWRHGHAHIDCDAIWTTTDGKTFAQATEDDAKHVWPMWAADEKTLYFMADGDGAENLYAREFWAGGATSQPQPVRELTHFHDGRLLWPAISTDGSTIVFERDFGLWKLDTKTNAVGPIDVRLRGVVTATGPQHQTFTRDASEAVVSHDGRKVAVVVRGQVFAAPVASADGPQPAFRVTRTDGIESDVSWSSDDRRIVYTSTRDGYRHLFLYDFVTRLERPVTTERANDSAPAFSPDDSAIAFVRNGTEVRSVALRPLDLGGRRRRHPTWPATTGATTRPTTAIATTRPTTEPTIETIRRLAGEIDADRAELARLRNAIGLGPERLLASGLTLPQPPYSSRRTLAWAPAGDYVAVMSVDAHGFRNAYLIPVAGGPARAVSFLANAESSSLAWAPDGSALLFGTGQRTEESELARVDIKPRTPTFRTDQFRDLFNQRPNRPSPEPTNPRRPTGGDDDEGAGTPSTNPTTAALAAPTTTPATRPAKTDVVFDDLDQRLSLLPVGLDVDEVAVSPDGKWAGVIGSAGGKGNVYVYPLDPLVDAPVARQLTASGDYKSDLQFAPDPGGGGTRLYFREGGRLRFVPVPARATAASTDAGSVAGGDVAVSCEMDVSFDRDKKVATEQAWRYLADHFHDPAMHGVDWPAVRERFAPYVDGARTPADERRLLALMMGELNASHLGVTAARDDPSGPPVARLGLTWDAAEYDRTGRLRVAKVLPYGPAALANVKVGSVVTAVDATPVERTTNLDALLSGKVGKDVTLAIADAGDVRLMAVSAAAERQLAYKAWLAANRDYVSRASHGRLGYVHLADMGTPELARLSIDLDAKAAAHDGVVVDVRNNNGGFVNGVAVDVFARRNYLTLQGRDAPRTAGRVALGQRYLGLPTVLVTNRETLSDGEDFTEGYQALGLGDTVGEPTAGWIIFTGGVTLVDGTGIRLPGDTVYDHAGQPMEMHPRPVTTLVTRPIGEATAGKDSQLDAAVADLIGKLDKPK